MNRFVKTGPTLRDLLDGEGGEELRRLWDTAGSAINTHIPPGNYVARLVALKPFEAGTGTRGLRMTFQLTSGACRGREIHHTLWLTKGGMAHTRRTLNEFGILELAEADRLPDSRLCRLTVSVTEDGLGHLVNEARIHGVFPVNNNTQSRRRA